MTKYILGSALFAGLCSGARAFQRVVAIGLDLSKRSHVFRPSNWLRFVVFLFTAFCGGRSEKTLSMTIAQDGVASVALIGQPIGCISIQRFRAMPIASTLAFFHQSASFPYRCTS